MKRKIILAAAAVSVIAVAVAWGNNARRQAPQPAHTEVTTTQQQEPYQFLLKTQQETLALFCLAQGEWEKIAEYHIVLDDLPAADQVLLKKGLALQDAEELQRSLEDYLPSS